MWGNYSSPFETECMSQKICANQIAPWVVSLQKSRANAIEAFHRTLGGRAFRHQQQENGDNVACPIASKCIIGLGPSHTNPQFNPIKQENKPKLPHIFEHIPTIQSTKRRSKYTNEKLESLGMEYLLVGDEQKRKTESKNAKKDDPRAANSSIPWVWLLKGGKRSF